MYVLKSHDRIILFYLLREDQKLILQDRRLTELASMLFTSMYWNLVAFTSLSLSPN